MAQELHHKVEGTLQTTDGSTVTVVSYTMPDNSVCTVAGWLVGRVPATGDSVYYQVRGGFKRHSGGAATIIGNATASSGEDAGISAATFVLTNSGNDIVLQATGVAATTIEWMAIMDVYLYQP